MGGAFCRWCFEQINLSIFFKKFIYEKKTIFYQHRNCVRKRNLKVTRAKNSTNFFPFLSRSCLFLHSTENGWNFSIFIFYCRYQFVCHCIQRIQWRCETSNIFPYKLREVRSSEIIMKSTTIKFPFSSFQWLLWDDSFHAHKLQKLKKIVCHERNYGEFQNPGEKEREKIESQKRTHKLFSLFIKPEIRSKHALIKSCSTDSTRNFPPIELMSFSISLLVSRQCFGMQHLLNFLIWLGRNLWHISKKTRAGSHRCNPDENL